MDWFSADLHLGHDNIRKYCLRPFSSVEVMDRAIIDTWNSMVKPSDRAFICGDVAFGKQEDVICYLKQLNGQLHLIRGNHDHRRVYKGDVLKHLIWMKEYHELKIKDEEMDETQVIVLFHYPIGSWNKMHHGSWQLHGHSHGSYPESDHLAQYDVGMDKNSFKPVSYDEVKAIMTRKVFKPVDHHGMPLPKV